MRSSCTCTAAARATNFSGFPRISDSVASARRRVGISYSFRIWERINWMNARTRRVLTELLDQVQQSYPIDPARVHLMGMSMGGGGSLTYTMYHKYRVRSDS